MEKRKILFAAASVTAAASILILLLSARNLLSSAGGTGQSRQSAVSQTVSVSAPDPSSSAAPSLLLSSGSSESSAAASSSKKPSSASKSSPAAARSKSPAAAPPTPSSQAVSQPDVTVSATPVSSGSGSVPQGVTLTAPTPPWGDSGLTSIPKVYEYGKTLLSSTQQSIYDQIAKSVRNLETSVTINTSIPLDEMETVIQYYWQDHAEIFYISGVSISCQYNPSTGQYLSYTIQPVYTYRGGKIVSMRAEMDQAIAQMLAVSRNKMTATDELSAETAFHDTLVGSIQYNMNEYNDPGSEPLSHTAYGAFVEKSAVCDGYSKAIKLLLGSQNMQSIVVTGTVHTSSGSGGHAWNMALVNGIWYYADATFDDPVNPYDPNFSAISHDYFNNTTLPRDHVLGVFNPQDPFAGDSENYSALPKAG